MVMNSGRLSVGFLTIRLSRLDDPTPLYNLASIQLDTFERSGDSQHLESAISNRQEAVECTADGDSYKPDRLTALGLSQKTRFQLFGQLSDIENAITNLREAVKLCGNETPDRRAGFLSNLGCGHMDRFARIGQLHDLESAITNFREADELIGDVHQYKPNIISNIAWGLTERYNHLSELSDLESAAAYSQEAAKLADDKHPNKLNITYNLGMSHGRLFDRFRRLPDLQSAIVNLQTATTLTPTGHVNKPERLLMLGTRELSRSECSGNLLDLENAIAHMQQAVDLTKDRETAKPRYLTRLGNTQRWRFARVDDVADLDNAITNIGKAVELSTDGDPEKSHCLLHLGDTQHVRFRRLGNPSDRWDAIASFKAAASNSAAQSHALHPHHILSAAKRWASLSLPDDIPSALDGYRTALEILPQVAWLGLNAQSRQNRVLQAKSEGLGCNAAACAIRLGLFEEAVELLDLARSVFWEQSSSLRSDFEELKETHPQLAKQLEKVGQALDASGFSESSFRVSEDKSRERRHLVGDWEALVKRVRQLPDYQTFLKPKPFRLLQQTATSGQVVIIIISCFGANALIFDDKHAIRHVPLPNVDLEALWAHSENISRSRPSGASSKDQQLRYVKQYLKPALRAVWQDVVEPIFRKIQVPLQYPTTEPLRRIYWYPTGPLTFIPIHAAGAARTGDVSRLVISSYVITLGSLSKARKRNDQRIPGPIKVLAINQPETPGQLPLPLSTMEVDNVAQVMLAKGWPKEDLKRLSSTDATVNRVLNAPDTCPWVHFSCYATQHPTKGMSSAFALHDENLDLSMIASKRLASARFAFLSACQAASGLRNLPGEAMHLAAGMQFAGFSSVIATMWSIRDDDAPVVAEHTYRYLLRNGMESIDLTEVAAALNHAVSRLREDPTVTVDRWAPFVYFGV